MPFMEKRNIILIVSKAGRTSKLILKYNSVLESSSDDTANDVD
jgi:hypothetical protein